MKKFNTKSKINIKRIIFTATFFFVIHFPFNYFINYFDEDDRSVTSSLIGSAVFSMIMGLVFGLFGRPKYRKSDEIISAELDQEENIQIESIAGIKEGYLVFPGKLYLTDQRLLFAKNKFLQDPEIKKVNRDELISVQPEKRYDLIDNGITLEVKSGKKHKFNFDDRDEVLTALRSELGIG